MKRVLRGFLSALSLGSRLPVRLEKEPDYSAIGLYMPLVGLAASAFACAGASLGMLVFGPGLLAALSATMAQYLPFNLFHLDGLLDTADAAGVQGDTEKRRAVLKDPRIGSFALFAGIMFLAARLGALAAIMGRAGPAFWGALVLAPAVGRYASMLVTVMTEPYGKSGLGSSIGRPSPVQSTIGFAIAATPAIILFGSAYGSIGAIASVLVGGLSAVVVAALLGHWYSKHMHGYSGDTLGAAVELGELLLLLLAAAIQR